MTPEPRGAERGPAGGSAFVVQKHAATRLHYDVRLELDGVLKSWAVPKGPSLDPADRRLAMETEDHPLEYGDFEGVIPEGEYGAGSVLLWDRGTWKPRGDPRQGLRAGRLKFELRGAKLAGGWNLVRIRGRDARDGSRSWLLIKERDREARPAAEFSVTDARTESVATGRDLADIAHGRGHVWHSKAPASRRGAGNSRARPSTPAAIPGGRRAALPRFLTPQLATLVTEPPAGDEWLHEMKFDGYRILARIEKGHAALLSRNDKDWTGRFTAIASAAGQLPVREALLDGEVAMLLPDGTTSFTALQNALTAGEAARLHYFAFDLLHLDGRDLTGLPLEARKAALETLVARAPTGSPIRLSRHVVGGGLAFFREACRLSLEGVVSKRRDGLYEPGRSRGWLKVKCIREQEFVIGGFTPPQGARAGLGALLLGVHDEEGRLVYAGKVGTGFTNRLARELRERLDRIRTETCPFARRPPGAPGASWVRPELVAEVEFVEWTRDGRLRHSSFKGLRDDKPVKSIVREEAGAVPGRERRRPDSA